MRMHTRVVAEWVISLRKVQHDAFALAMCSLAQVSWVSRQTVYSLSCLVHDHAFLVLGPALSWKDSARWSAMDSTS